MLDKKLIDSPPHATYRLQVSGHLTFKEIEKLIPYFQKLGISHLYLSPILKAKRGSTHGYDFTDPTQLNPEIGTLQDFEALANSLHTHAMGLLLDIVPNHMYIGNDENPWWHSILEKGEDSPFASFFDINWHPPKQIFDNKVFLPLLDQLFGEALENKRLQVRYHQGRFLLYVDDLALPTDPKTWGLILEPLYKEVEKLPQKEGSEKLRSILNSFSQPGSDTLLHGLMQQYPFIYEMLEKHLATFNGLKDHPASFDALEEFLKAQHYRLCDWRVANDEINYRRFFDLFEYASLRIEKKEAFQAVHALIFQWIQKGWVNGLRIDHIDGLWDPQQYLEDLNKGCEPLSVYIVAEKILMGNEQLRQEWPLQGSVGYDFLNQVNGLFVYQPNKQKIIDIYKQFTGRFERIWDIKYNCKKLILNSSLSSELHLLTLRLNQIAENHRHSQDFPFESLKKALCEIIACFPVYRTYTQVSSRAIDEGDYQSIEAAITRAKRLNCLVDPSLFTFIQNILFLKYPDGIEEGDRIAYGEFVMHFQQVTGPVMAKGLEDTAFYRYFPLCSLNEVGSDLGVFGINKENFHKKNLERFATWPHSLLTTSTHDTKRSEDVRARINVLSEIPDQWQEQLKLWSQLNAPFRSTIDEECVPDPNEEYLFYQTVVGTWPFNGIEASYVKRLSQFMEKAVKEAKLNSSWIHPNQSYDEAIQCFVHNVLNHSPFIDSVARFSSQIAYWGVLNSLSQLILKLTSPGIPDLYQGNELWDLSLVDPDNRASIDFSHRQELIQERDNMQTCFEHFQDGKIKLFITQKILQLRQRLPLLFSQGIYLPLTLSGTKDEHLIAYARVFEKSCAIVLTTRFFSFLELSSPNCWAQHALILPDELASFTFKDLLTERLFAPATSYPIQTLFSHMPFVIFEKIA